MCASCNGGEKPYPSWYFFYALNNTWLEPLTFCMSLAAPTPWLGLGNGPTPNLGQGAPIQAYDKCKSICV